MASPASACDPPLALSFFRCWQPSSCPLGPHVALHSPPGGLAAIQWSWKRSQFTSSGLRLAPPIEVRGRLTTFPSLTIRLACLGFKQWPLVPDARELIPIKDQGMDLPALLFEVSPGPSKSQRSTRRLLSGPFFPGPHQPRKVSSRFEVLLRMRAA